MCNLWFVCAIQLLTLEVAIEWIQVEDVGSRIEGVVLSGEVAHRGGGVFAAGNDVGEAVADPGRGPQRTAGRRQPRQRSACSNAQKPGLQNSPARFH